MLISEKLLNAASAKAASAKDGSVTHQGVCYTLTFDHAHWHYFVSGSDGFELRLNCKSLSVAKRELVKWLSS